MKNKIIKKPSFPKVLLHLEGLIIMITGLFFYYFLGLSWTLFLLILFPDLPLLIFIFNKKLGVVLYNLTHTYVIPLILFPVSIIYHNKLIASLCLIWIIHIGIDRTLGFGLKYPTSFYDNHLKRV